MSALDPRATRAMRCGSEDELATAMEPWNGQLFVRRPPDYQPGLFRMHQIIASDLLRQRDGLTNWAARLLQTIRYQFQELSPAQTYWLNRLERDLKERSK